MALYHGEFAAVSALMEYHGVPIDMEIFPSLADEGAWSAVRDAMVPAIDAQYGVYVRNAAGEWSFSLERFEAYCARSGIAWPRLESGKLNMTRKTFEDMSKGQPQLEALRQLRHTRDKMRKIKLAVGADGRNRTVLWPFKAKTSRTQPKASQWIFSPAVWLRSLIKPGPGMAVAYIDYSSMEFLIAAVLSDGHCGPVNAMLDMYLSGDPYLSFAKRVGAVPSTATKKSHAEVRDKYKVMLLAVQYGMSSETLAGRLGVSSFEAHEMLNQHRELFAQYWMVRRLDRPLVTDWRHADGLRMGVPDRHRRAHGQRALDPKLAGAGDRRRHSEDQLHPGGAPRHQASSTRARRGADRGADRADRGRRGADAGDHAAGVADRTQQRQRRAARAAH